MYCVFDIVCQTMAAIGATSQSSVILSASQPGSTEILRCTSLEFDRNRNLYTWDGTVDELQEFCVDNLELLEPKLSSSERCISLKTKGVTFTLYPSTKTLQVQGTDQKEVKRKMQVFLPTDQGNQSENSELSTDVEDVISKIQGDNDESTIGSMKGVVREVLDQDVPASPGVQHLSCKGCNALKLELQNVTLEVEELKRQMVYSNEPTTANGQPSASSKPQHADIIRLQESNNSLIDTVQILANLLSRQSCHSGKDHSSIKESQESRAFPPPPPGLQVTSVF